MANPRNLDVSMTDLSREISTKVEELTRVLKSTSTPPPSLKADGPSDYPSNGEMEGARYAIVDACTDLINLAFGPREFIHRKGLCLPIESFVLGALYHYDIPNNVPLVGSASYEDISRAIGLSKDKTERIIKHAMTSSIFYEPEPGMVAHTANSIAPVRNPQLKAWLGTQRGETQPSMLKLEEAFEKWGDTGRANETAFTLAQGKSAEDTFWSVLVNDGEGEKKGWRMKRFGMAMGAKEKQEPSQQSPFNVMFDWDSLGKAVVVDIGGGGGHISADIATFHPKLQFIVQDQPSQEIVFNSRVPADLRSRISFQPYDFFTPQPVKEADVYFLSHVLHDWSDEMALKILRQIVPAMKATSRILLLERVVAEFGEVSNAEMQIARSADLLMLSLFNAKERTKDDWEVLVESADERLIVKNIVSSSAGGSKSLIEIGLRDRKV